MAEKKRFLYLTVIFSLLASLLAQPAQSLAQDEPHALAQARVQEQVQQAAQLLAQDKPDFSAQATAQKQVQQATRLAQDGRNLSADVDGDGLSNETELNGWCNAAGCFTTDPFNSDSDNDGLTDGEEKLFGTNPHDDHDPGIFVKYQNSFQTSSYYSWQRFGSQYIALPTPGQNAVVVRRGTTFSIGGPVSATLEITKSITSLTTLTPVRDSCAGGWSVTVPPAGTVGIYGLTVRDGSWSKRLDLYVIFQLPTDKTDAFVDAFVYDGNPDNIRDTSAVLYYEGSDDSGVAEYTHADYAWIPEGEWIAHGWAWLFNTDHYTDFVFKDHVMPTINGKTSTWDAGNALVQHVDDVTCFGNPRALGSSWCVLNPSQCGPAYDNRNECSNISGLLTAFNRAAGIPARPVFTDRIHASFDHSTEIWTKPTSGSQNWYVARGYNENEYGDPASHKCQSPDFTGGNVKLRTTLGWYTSGQGVYSASENWPLADMGGSGWWWDKFRQASWDNTTIVKRSWWDTRFMAYWGWSAEPTVTGSPPYDWPQLPAPPTASFTGAPLSGVKPLTVTFADQSTGQVRTRLWNFGDGINSAVQNPTHVYTRTGDFSVTLVVTGAGGSNTATRANYTHVSEPPPVANFVGNPRSGTRPLTVAFTDTSTGIVTSWLWNFGDGATSAVQNPTHVYNAAGDFNVSLTVTGPGGTNTKTVTGYIHVSERAPVAGFTGSPTSGTRPLTVTFTDQSTGSITSWSWKFGDGATSTAQNPSHTYGTAGGFDVSLKVTGPGGSDTVTQTGYIQVQDPLAGLSGLGLRPALEGDTKQYLDQPVVASPSIPTSTTSPADPVIQFGQVVADYGVDLDGDGRYDQLVFKIQVEAEQAGHYWIRGRLAGTRAEAIGDIQLEKGHYTIELPFNGQDIYMNKVDGPYTLQALWITDVENPTPADFAEKTLAYLSPAYKTQAYRFSQFGVAGATLSDPISHAIDTDGDGYADALVVETDLNIAKPGTYTVQGALSAGQNKTPIVATWTGSDSKVTLQFGGLRDTVGPYTLLGLHVRDAAGQVTDGIPEPFVLGQVPELSTKPILMGDQAAMPSNPSLIAPTFVITNTGYSDRGADTDGDGRFDQLVITVAVQVASGEGGQAYRIEGWLVDSNDSLVSYAIGAPTVLTDGLQSLSLAFDGRILNEHGVDGPYTLVALKALPGNSYTVLNTVEVAYTTSTYNHGQFETAAIAPAANVFADNMENGTGQWMATNPPWSLDTSVWNSYSHSWKASVSGSRVGSLTTTLPLNLSNYAQPTLRFKTCYNMQSANDRGYLEASADGVNWTRVNTYTNSTFHWSTELLDLSNWGKASNLRLRFNANSQTSLLWYVDDVYLDAWPGVTGASFTYSPQHVRVQATTTFTASYASIDTTLPVTYTWDWDDGSPLEVTHNPSVTHQFPNTVDYIVGLTVENPYDSASISQTLHANPATDLSIAKLDSPDPVVAGNSLTYQITVTNHGPSMATGVIVTDALPSGLTLPAATPSQGHCSITSTTTCDLGSIASGADATLTIVASVAPSAARTLTNTATVADNEYDDDTTNNAATTTTTVYHAPQFTSVPVTAATQDIAYTYAITATDLDAGDILITSPTKPAWLTLTDHGDRTATLSGTPTNADVGQQAVALLISDSDGLTAIQPFIIVVANVNDAPQFTSEPVLAKMQGVLYTYNVIVTDPDLIYGDLLTITAPTLPGWLTFTDHHDGTATLSGTPTNDDVGQHAVTLQARDSAGAIATQSFTITVKNVNDAPTAVNDSYSTNEDTPLVVTAPGVLGNDTDPDHDPLRAILISTTSHGTLTLDTDGSFVYTPTANYNGADSFTYRANDYVADSDVATVSITINPVNDAPVAVDDEYFVVKNEVLSVNAPGVLNNDSDVEHSPLTASLVSGPAHGTLTLNADGSLTYMPALDYNGSDSFTYKANDGALDSNIATVTITVAPDNPVPVITSLNPTTVTVGGPAFTLLVTGTHFVGNSTVYWMGSARATTFVNSGQLGAAILASDIAASGQISVTVVNPAPGGGTSNTLFFTVVIRPAAVGDYKLYLPLVARN